MSLLQNTMAKSGTANFYNGVVTTSMRFDDGDTVNLNLTSSQAPTSTALATFSCWVKRCALGSACSIFGTNGSGTSGDNASWIAFTSANYLDFANVSGGAYTGRQRTTMQFRDTSAWYHIVVRIDLANSTASNRVRIYVNGSLAESAFVQDSGAPTAWASDGAMQLTTAVASARIGAIGYATANPYDGYLADVNLVDGASLAPASFGEDKNGVWIPIAPAVSEYGNCGFRLQFLLKGTAQDSAGMGADTSGKARHFAKSSGNLASDSAMPDSPENNFATWNVLSKGAGTSTAEGNLKAIYSSNNQAGISSTFSVDTGKYYFEVGCQTASVFIGVAPSTYKNPDNINSTTGSIHYAVNGNKSLAGTQTSYGASYGDGDVIGVALNLDDGEVTFYKNNSSQGALSLTSGLSYGISSASGSSTSTFTVILNSGQDSSFAGTETAQGNTDGNGIGDFYYAPPSGFLALCTANLPEPTIGANSDTQADDHFNTVLYTGNGGTQDVTGFGFQPDWIWDKSRNQSGSHMSVDSSRGVGKYLRTNLTSAEVDDASILTHFISDGVTVGDINGNASSSSAVMRGWKANGGTTSSNSDGSITSTVQANTDAGFSIVTYTGTGSNATVGHGLSSVPQMYIVKRRSNTGNWYTYHESIGNTKRLRLDENSVATTESTAWNNTSPTSSVFSIGTSVDVNAGSNTYVSYVFSEIEGYSKFDSYTGNVALDGTFVYTGFEPAFILFTNTVNAGYNWPVWDGVINPFNVATKHVFSDLSQAEGAFPALDLLSNGFKLRHPDLYYNAGVKFIYMAFAKSSFKYANAR